MRNLLTLPIAGIFALNLGACSDQPTSPANELEAPPISLAVVFNGKFGPFGIAVANPCNGEGVTGQFNAHVVVRSTGTDHFGVHVNLKGRGQGTSGAKYEGKAVFNLSINTAAAQEATATFSLAFISQGNDDNFVVNAVFHITINANGDVTSLHFNLADGVCRG